MIGGKEEVLLGICEEAVDLLLEVVVDTQLALECHERSDYPACEVGLGLDRACWQRCDDEPHSVTCRVEHRGKLLARLVKAHSRVVQPESNQQPDKAGGELHRGPAHDRRERAANCANRPWQRAGDAVERGRDGGHHGGGAAHGGDRGDKEGGPEDVAEDAGGRKVQQAKKKARCAAIIGPVVKVVDVPAPCAVCLLVLVVDELASWPHARQRRRVINLNLCGEGLCWPVQTRAQRVYSTKARHRVIQG